MAFSLVHTAIKKLNLMNEKNTQRKKTSIYIEIT